MYKNIGTIFPRWLQLAFIFLLVSGLFFGLSGHSSAKSIVRHPIPHSDFPIARAVEVPPDATLVYLSGQVPSVVNEQAVPNTIKAFGDTQTQTRSVLSKIQTTLSDLGLTMADVVKMQVFLVGEPNPENPMDFTGFMEGYKQFFGTEEQPNLPARSVMQVAGLANPGWLVEIEVVAVRS